MCGTYVGCATDYPNAHTYDGLNPFTTVGSDIFTPNPAFFQRVDDMVNLAANHGITVFFDLSETGGWMSQIDQNGTTNNFNLGAYIGNRYKNFPNIIYLSGNDYQTWNVATDDANMRAIANGVKSVDPNRIQTVELNYQVSNSLDNQNWASIIKLNFTYTYRPTYAEVLAGYNQTPTIPDFMGEANYENESINISPDIPYTERLQEYWTMTSGATGQLYGNHDTWADGTNWAYESTHLDTTRVAELKIMADFFNSIAWYNLVPDQNHTFVTAGYGTFSATTMDITTNDYVTAAITPDRSLGVAYLPSNHTITVDMSKLGGQTTARWFDPTSGSYVTIGSLANSGTHQFVSPPAHSDGHDDWVLILQASATPDSTPPSTPTNLTSTTVSGSAIGLSWAASTDNVGVDHYQIYRNGTAIGTSASNSYTDNTVSAGSSYTYTVKAFDLTGNASSASSGLIVTIPNTITIGETNALSTGDNGNAGFLLAQKATLSQSAKILSLSFYTTNGTGKLRLGIYDSTGTSGGPGALKAQTAEITPAAGWNTANVTSQVTLSPGTYWLAYTPSDNNLAFVKGTDASSSTVLCGFTYGALPASFCSPTQTDAAHWSFYATLDTGSAGGTTKTGDLNNDNSVNITDLSILLTAWGTTNSAITTNLGTTGTINITCLSILLSHWGT